MGGTLTSRRQAHARQPVQPVLRWESCDVGAPGAQARCWVLRERFLMGRGNTAGAVRSPHAHRTVDREGDDMAVGPPVP